MLLKARLLLLLTDQEGLYTHDPRQPGAELVREVTRPRLLDELEVGAAARAGAPAACAPRSSPRRWRAPGGVASVIAHGALAGVVRAAALGEPVGTRFVADERPVSAYKLWLRYGKPATGRIDVDAGAQRALAEDGASLLPVGVTGVHGRFARRRRGGDRRPGRQGLRQGHRGGSAPPRCGARSASAAAAPAVHRDELVVFGQPLVD